MKSLRSTIFFFFVVLLLAVQGVFVLIIYRATQQQEADQVRYQLDTARTVFDAQFQSRSDSLAAFAETAARDFGLKQVFQEDTRSFLVALNNHRQRINADIAMAIGADGLVSAQLVNQLEADGTHEIRIGAEQGDAFRFPRWLELPEDARLYPLGSEFYQLSLAPLTSGSLIIGWIGFGYNIDQRLAGYFAELTELTTTFAIGDDNNWSVLASSTHGLAQTASAERRPDSTNETLLINQIMNGTARSGLISTTYSLGEVEGGRQLSTVMYGDRTDLLAELRDHWWEIGLLAALTLCLSLAGAFLIAMRISRPVQLLVAQARQIGGGKYDLTFDVKAHGELGELAEEFIHMQQAVLSREQFISHQAYHDELTGLPNRNRLIQILEQRCAHPSQTFVIYKLCIRRINTINSSLGHHIGDEVIRTAAKRFESISPEQSLFHLGGSEFVFLRDSTRIEHVQAWMSSPNRLIAAGFRYQSIFLHIELQAGAAIFPQHGSTSSALLQNVATALQHAERTNLPFQLYDPTLSKDNADYLELVNDLKTAIEQEQLVLHYQPKLDLEKSRVSHVEALVRWNHPDKGMIAPDRFIGIAEETGLINSLTCWVLAEAARQHGLWQAQGIGLSIAVNVSALNLTDTQFYDTVMSTLSQAGRNRDTLSLEITESAVASNLEATIDLLRRFESEQIKLSIDDYGTGYSSLSQLKQLPVQELKIDKVFIQNLLQDQDNMIIVRSTIELAHNMGLRVVAEGVEDSAALSWLSDIGCDVAQGFLICRPKPADELKQWLIGSDYFKGRPTKAEKA